MEAEYHSLKAQWLAGKRDRELGLQLMYFAWIHWADPMIIPDFIDDPDAPEWWRSVFAHFDGEASTDVEFLFVAGLMASLFPYALGDEVEWRERGARMLRRAMSPPIELSSLTFENRGSYGVYFAHQLSGHLKVL